MTSGYFNFLASAATTLIRAVPRTVGHAQRYVQERWRRNRAAILTENLSGHSFGDACRDASDNL